jgi:hypothetical protein
MSILDDLGIPAHRSATQVASMIGISSSRLTPSALAQDSEAARILALARDVLHGRTVGDPGAYGLRVWSRAHLLVERLDEGATIDVVQLGQRLVLWGMPTSLDWVARLHAAGAEEVFARGGWCAVRAWAREVVR